MTRPVRFVWIGFYSIIGIITLLLLATNMGLLGKMPSIEDLQNPSASIASEVYADDGAPLGKYYLEDRSPVALNQISPNVVKALLATEDVRFYEHSGIDGIALLRVVKGMGNQGGGSTITQQLALGLFGGQRANNKIERGIQKLKEWIIAVKLERNFTKDEIVNYYLNTVSYSDNVFGIRNAARTFYQKEPIDLTISEAAVLVGMVNAPTLYNPRRNPGPATERRNLVLDRMKDAGYISPEENAKLKPIPIKLNYKKLDYNIGQAPYFRESALKDEIKRLLKDKLKPNGEPYNIYRDGIKIYTTINLKMQHYAEEAVRQNIMANQRIFNGYSFVKTGSVFKGRDKEIKKFIMQTDRWRFQKEEGLSEEENLATFNKKVKMKIFTWNKDLEKDTTITPLDSIKYLKTHLQTSFMAMEPQTGHVKAWVGGIDFKTFKIDHANINIKRQVGSTIKPMLYAQAVEEAGFSPETPLDNVPQYFPGSGWVPANMKGARGGSPPMASCIALSLNGAAAYLMKQLGPQRFVDFLQKCKIQTQIKPYPSLALGSCDLSLYEMMWMYTMFPGRGFNTRPQYITRIEDRNGNLLVSVQPEITEVISEVTAYTMAKMMKGAISFGTGKAMKSYGITAEMGAKTGTTNNNTDAWFMVYTPELLVGTWVGCDENWIHFPSSSTAGYGGAAALPATGIFLKSVYNDRKLGYNPNAAFIKPAISKNDIIYDYIENLSGSNAPDAQLGDEGNGTADQYMEEVYEIPEDPYNQALGKPTNPLGDSTPIQPTKKDSPNNELNAKAVMPPPLEEKSIRELRKEQRRKAREQKNAGDN